MIDNLSISKVVATPNSLSWSQAYNAGTLFAVVSLTRLEESENLSLNSTGKEIINILESEYFTLETKDLESLKRAFQSATEKIPEGIKINFLVACIINNILYLLSQGEGKVILKRKDKTGIILQNKGETEVITSSGLLENEDIFVLQTPQFENVIEDKELIKALESNSTAEIAEVLSPKVHQKNEGGEAAIFVLFKNHQSQPEEEIIEKSEPQLVINHSQGIQEENFALPVTEKESMEEKEEIQATTSNKFKIPRFKKIFLVIAIILVGILAFGIYSTIKNNEANNSKKIFQEIFPKAQKKFDEGSALLSLNENLAKEDLLAAQKILNENKSKLKPGSDEEKQLLDLLKKIDDALAGNVAVDQTGVKSVELSESSLLDYQNKNSLVSLSRDNDNFYFADNDAVYTVNTSDSKKTIIKNKDYWTDPGGLGIYSENVYLLDKKTSQIFKFVSPDYGKSNYFSEEQNFSDAVGITIDGSIYVLHKGGSIDKFTKGKPDTFKLSGLDKPLSNSTKIYTNKEIDNLYVLDNGNSRIVVLSKEGAFKAQYPASVVKTAKGFEVLEKDKKIYILSNNKLWQLEIK